jgi:hypothetical protein
LVAKVKPSVVNIEAFDNNGKSLGTATGWVYDTGAGIEVVTNAHVVDHIAGQRIRMTTLSGIALVFDHWDGYDEIADVGLIRLKPDSSLSRNGYPLADSALSALCLRLADPNSVREGQAITVIGDPLGVVGVTSNGIISAIRDNELQIDAPISQGSSGSPVVNRNGEVVAMVKGSFVCGQNMNLCARLDAIKDALLGAYAGAPVNRHNSQQPASLRPKDQVTINGEIKDFIGSYLANCGDGSIAHMHEYIYNGLLIQWYDQKKPTYSQVLDNVLEYGTRWKNQSVLWIEGRCYIDRAPNDNYEIYYLSVPIQWTGDSVKTHKRTVVRTFFCTFVYRDADGHYAIIGAWNDKNPRYHG